MKNFLTSIGLILLFVVAVALAGKFESIYTQTGIVIDIENENEVIVNDSNGEIWAFQSDGFNKKDKVKMIMDNNYTKEKTDDKIIKVMLDKN